MNTQQANADGTKFVINSDFDIVFVSFNYRVGPFGFLTSKESQADGDLNVGILDQRKVMHWVQKHIDKVSPIRQSMHLSYQHRLVWRRSKESYNQWLISWWWFCWHSYDCIWRKRSRFICCCSC